MTKKAARPKKKATTPTEPYTTIRLIEKASPCRGEYFNFLQDFHGVPISKNSRDAYFAAWDKPKPSQSGIITADTPILLRDILVYRSKLSSMTGESRVRWLVTNGCAMPTSFDRDVRKLLNTSCLAIRVALHADQKTLARVLKGVPQ